MHSPSYIECKMYKKTETRCTGKTVTKHLLKTSTNNYGKLEGTH